MRRILFSILFLALNAGATGGIFYSVARAIGINGTAEEDTLTFPGQIEFTIRYNEASFKYDLLLSDAKEKDKLLGSLDKIQLITQFAGQSTGLRNVSRLEVRDAHSTLAPTNWFVLQTDSELVLVYKGQTGFDVVKLPGHDKRILDVSSGAILHYKPEGKSSKYVLLSIAERAGQRITYMIDLQNGDFRAIDSRYTSLQNLITIKPNENKFEIANKEMDIERALSRASQPVVRVGGSVATNDIGKMMQSSQVPVPATAATHPSGQEAASHINPDSGGPKPPSVLVDANFEIKHGEDSFQIYSHAKGENRGIFVKRKSDGTVVKMSVLNHLPAVQGANHGFVIEDGILSHPNLIREVDLVKTEKMDAFEVESTFIPISTAGDQKHPEENKTAVDFVVTKFKNYKSTTKRLLAPPAIRSGLVDSIALQISSGEPVTQILVGESTDKDLVLAEVARRVPRTWKTITLDTSGFGDIGTVGVLQESAAKLSAAIRTVPTVLFSPKFMTLAGYGVVKGSDTDVLELLGEDFSDHDGYFKLVGAATNKERILESIKDQDVVSTLTIADVEDLDSKELKTYLTRFLKKKYPKLTINERDLEYLIATGQSVRPVNAEPSRTSDFIKGIARTLLADPQTKQDLKSGKIKSVAISRDEIERAVTYHYGISEALATESGQLKLLENFKPVMAQSIAGHEHIIDKFHEGLEIGLARLHAPRGGMLMEWLEGPPGVGKTELALSLAKSMGVPLKDITMSQFNSGSGASSTKLLAMMAKALNKNPYTVLLLDEIEKADFEVLQGLFTVLSSKTFNYLDETGNGKTEERKQSVYLANIIMTSNGIGDIVLEWLADKIKNDPKYDNMTSDQLDKEFKKHMTIDEIKEILVTGTSKIPRGIPRPLLDRVQIHVAFPPGYDALVGLYLIKLKELKARTKANMEIEIQLGRSANQNTMKELDIIKHFARYARDQGMSVRDGLRVFENSIALTAARIKSKDADYRSKKFYVIDPYYKTSIPVPNQCLRHYMF